MDEIAQRNRALASMDFQGLLDKTGNFSNLKWRGVKIWQNIFDLWIMQEVLHDVEPDLLIEVGTHQGGSAKFYADLFDLRGAGHVLSIDIMPPPEIDHPRIRFLTGDSTSSEIQREILARIDEAGVKTIMVILDGDHSAKKVLEEMKMYQHFVTDGSYMLVQDGVIDTLEFFKAGRPGPYSAIQEFMSSCNHSFEVDDELQTKFPFTHHPDGWLRKLKKPTS